MKRLVSLLLVGTAMCLTGCPIPAYYNLLDNKGVFEKDSLIVNISSVHPWRTDKKKTVNMHVEVENRSQTQTLHVPFSDLVITGLTDTFSLQEKWIQPSFSYTATNDTLTLPPGEKASFGLSFSSTHTYSKRRYKRSIEPDTLLLDYTPAATPIRLGGKRNY